MMDKDTLRRADIFSGGAIVALGLFIVSQALQMPMKDSYGGVQNVWYVSPALFPLFIGGMLVLLGIFLMRTAFNTVGRAGFTMVLRYLFSSAFIEYLKRPESFRFYGIVSNLLIFVFLLVPRIDFFIAATLFLLLFFLMFYTGSLPELKWLLNVTVGIGLMLLLGFAGGLFNVLVETMVHLPDLSMLIFLACLTMRAVFQAQRPGELDRKYYIALIIAYGAPLTIGIIFKYFLLVPMPHEGLVVLLLDAIWYADFWS